MEQGTATKSPAARVFLWCVPRSASTAFNKLMSNVPGVEVWHEPFTVAHLNTTLYNPKYLPENQALIKIRKNMRDAEPQMLALFQQIPRGKLQEQKLFSFPWVKEQLEADVEAGKSCVFVKDMAMAWKFVHRDLPSGFRHTFLIRDPASVLISMRRVIATDMVREADVANVDVVDDAPFLMMNDVFKQSYELWKYITETDGAVPVVMDADDLLNHPEVMLPKYFKEIGLEFNERYLSWDTSRDILMQWRGCYEIVTGGGQSHVYSSAFDSSCLKPITKPKPDVSSLSPKLQEYIKEAMPYYQEMYEARMRVT